MEVADAGALAPDTDFDRAWALAVVERALVLLQSESESAGQAAPFAALQPWLTPAGAPAAQAPSPRSSG